MDLVYLWADFSDRDWLQTRARDRQAWDGTVRDADDDLQPFCSEDLRYSLRAATKHIRDLGTTYLVVDGQRPAWLAQDVDGLHIIDYRQLLGEEKYLPSYNSQAIESCISRIEGLGEHFLYSNDDFFLTADVDEGDFFDKRGRPIVRLGRAIAPTGPIVPGEDPNSSAIRNANGWLDERIGRRPRLTIMHRPVAMRREDWVKAEAAFPDAFEDTRRSRFRSDNMVALHSHLLPYWLLSCGKARAKWPSLLRKDLFHWSNDLDANRRTMRRIRRPFQNAFCMAEIKGLRLTPDAMQQFQESMQELFPGPSPFEINRVGHADTE